jgi:hypothetical protein
VRSIYSIRIQEQPENTSNYFVCGMMFFLALISMLGVRGAPPPRRSHLARARENPLGVVIRQL